MGFDIGRAKEKLLPATIKFAGETLRFQFSPMELDDAWYENQSAAMENEDIRMLADCAIGPIKDWDMTNEGEEVAPDPDVVYEMIKAVPFYGKISRKMQELAVDEKGEQAKGRRRES